MQKHLENSKPHETRRRCQTVDKPAQFEQNPKKTFVHKKHAQEEKLLTLRTKESAENPVRITLEQLYSSSQNREKMSGQ